MVLLSQGDPFYAAVVKLNRQNTCSYDRILFLLEVHSMNVSELKNMKVNVTCIHWLRFLDRTGFVVRRVISLSKTVVFLLSEIICLSVCLCVCF